LRAVLVLGIGAACSSRAPSAARDGGTPGQAGAGAGGGAGIAQGAAGSGARGGSSAAGTGAGGRGITIDPNAGAMNEGGATVDDQTACAKWSVTGEALPSILEMVIDTSVSMNDRPPTGGPTKWQITRDGLSKALAGLSSDTAVGVLFYPNEDSTGSSTPADVSTCVAVDQLLPLALLGTKSSSQRTLLENALNAVVPIGYTPTHDAYHYALTEGLDTTALRGERFMLLFTDGAPTLALDCVGTPELATPAPTQPIIDEIQAAKERGVRTFVIGAPGTEVSLDGTDARRWLSVAARAGGTAQANCSDDGPNYCHIDLSQTADFKTALSDGLASITGQIIPCSYALPEPPAGQLLDTDNVNLYVSTPDSPDPQVIPREEGAKCTDGWQLAGDQVVLCADRCEQVRGTAGTTVKLLFGCASIMGDPR
jgi:hypothetical protein